jgi:aspartate beta-hydroxylase
MQPTAEILDLARRLAQEGKFEQAEQAYSRVVDAEPPAAAEALNYIALRAMHHAAPNRSVALLKQALLHEPDNAFMLRNLGNACEMSGQLEAAAKAFTEALARMPTLFSASLGLGRVNEKFGRHYHALTAYFSAIVHAQIHGQWTNEASTPPPLRRDVERAMAFVNEGRRSLFSGILEPLRERYGRDALRRVEASLGMYLGDLPIQYQDPRQRPTFLYFPELPARPYWGHESLPWLGELESQVETVRDELLQVLHGDQGIEPVHKIVPDSQMGKYLSSSRGVPAWDGYFFYRHGARYDDNWRRCPRTAAILESLPLIRIREHAPEVLFSVLKPGTRILPHRGVTNTRLVTHLPLIVPPDCALSVVGETHVWKEGQCVVFDDTFEHEAWNESGQVRVVLILDVWNPYLSEAERNAVADLIGGIGDFNRDCGLDM